MLSVSEYKTMSNVSPLPSDEELRKLIENAEHDIDAMTFSRISAVGFDSLTEYQQSKVKLAVSRQADFCLQYGELLNNPLASYSINGVSMSWDKSMIKEQCGVKTCSGVIACLITSGLMYRGVVG